MRQNVRLGRVAAHVARRWAILSRLASRSRRAWAKRRLRSSSTSRILRARSSSGASCGPLGEDGASSLHGSGLYEYYLETGDPRSAWADDPDFPFALQSLSGYPGGSVPWSYSLKHTSYQDPYRLASGREMVLIRAEALLAADDWQQAMTLIHDHRTSTSRPRAPESLVSHTTGQPLEPWPASSLEEAWTALKRKRATEMWLEARRMGDLRRWKENNVPGEDDWPDWESISFHFVQNPAEDCLPVAQVEIDGNPNF